MKYPLGLLPVFGLFGCSHGPTLPTGFDIHSPAEGNWKVTRYECRGGTPSESLKRINDQITSGSRYLWYSVSSLSSDSDPTQQKNVRIQSFDPFNWSSGGCIRSSLETWLYSSQPQISVLNTESKGTLSGVVNPSHAQTTSCPVEFAHSPDVRVLSFSQTSGVPGFVLVGPSLGYCQAGGALAMVFEPNPLSADQWPSVISNLNPSYTSPTPTQVSQQVHADLIAYQDSFGMLSPSRGGGSLNGLLYSSEGVVLLKELGFITQSDVDAFNHIIDICSVSPGLYRRNPSNGDQEAQDDYIGVAAAAGKINPVIANQILSYGENISVSYEEKLTLLGLNIDQPIHSPLHFVYNNVQPGTLQFPDGRINWNAWIGKQPGAVAHFYLSAGQIPSDLLQAAWSVSIASPFTAKSTDYDSWILSWLLTVSGDGKTSVTRDSVKLWQYMFEKAFPGGRNQLFRLSFVDADHPVAHYWLDEDNATPRP